MKTIRFASAILCFAAHPAAALEMYSVSKVNSLIGASGYLAPTAINNSGSLLCEWQETLTSPTRATLFRNKQSGNINLGTLGGTNSGGRDVNVHHVAVGFAENSNGVARAVVFSGIGINNKDLGTLNGSDANTSSVAMSINDDGEIVGQAYRSDGLYRATLFSGNGAGNKDLGTLGGGTSWATSINSSGQIVGNAQLSDGANHATLFSGSGSGNTDLGTLGGVGSRANRIGDAGTIVGDSDLADGSIHATRFVKGNIPQDLGTLGGRNSSALAVNNSRDIVGHSDSSRGTRAFIVRGFGKMTDLNTLISPGSGVVLTSARDINNKGQILASGMKNGNTFVYLLDPKPGCRILASASPSAKGRVSGAGNYAKGDEVTLVAIPDKGRSFSHWSENGKSVSNKKVYQFTANKARKLQANFQ